MATFDNWKDSIFYDGLTLASKHKPHIELRHLLNSGLAYRDFMFIVLAA